MAKTVKAEVIDLLKKISKKYPERPFLEIIKEALYMTSPSTAGKYYGVWSDVTIRDALQKYLQLKD